MTSKLDQLKTMTVVVAETGDIKSIRAFRPTDCTTNPTLNSQGGADAGLFRNRRRSPELGQPPGSAAEAVNAAICDRLAVSFGAGARQIVPGRVSTEVDADLSFDTARTVDKARAIIADYESRGIGRERILVKMASHAGGLRAPNILQARRDRLQSHAAVQPGAGGSGSRSGRVPDLAFGPGRILDWYAKAEGRGYEPEEDPGVLSVRRIYAYYKRHGYKTVVMGASFRSTGEIEALAGCDRLTIAPSLLEALAKDETRLERRLDPIDAAHAGVDEFATDEPSFRFAMNEDPMATEKLAEGIRMFAKDLRTLRGVIAQKVDGAAAAEDDGSKSGQARRVEVSAGRRDTLPVAGL